MHLKTFTYLINTYNEFREVNPLKASAAISVILLLLKFLEEKKINMTISNTSHTSDYKLVSS